jgi:coenzyme PQQ synthesis protein D (PqqD)
VSTVYRRSPTIEMAPLQDETILFDPQKNQFCLLNRTASFIWNQLAMPASSHALGEKICESFSGVALDNAVRDANSALQEMQSLNFVVEEPVPGDQP